MRIELPRFEDKKKMIDYLVKNKAEIMALKKMATKEFVGNNELKVDESKFTLKASTNSEDTSESITRKIIGNTYYYMDSHDDVHVDGIFSKTIKENQGRIFHLHDHIHQITAKVGDVKLIEEVSLPWAYFGINKQGNTTALVMTSEIRKEYNATVFKAYLQNEIQQHSVGQIYVKMELAVNDPEYKQEYSEWEKYFPMIGNPELAEQKGFFWVQKESKLKEISGLLFDGSNSLTPTMEADKHIAPSSDTQTIEPSKDTQSNRWKYLL